MSGILAIFNRDGQPIEPTLPQRMLAASPERALDGENLWRDGAVALGHQHFWVTPEEFGERQPLVDLASGCVITADLRLDNRLELIRALETLSGDLNQATDAGLVLLAYLRWGTGCAGHLLGDFAFAIWDPRSRELFIGRDALGIRNLCYYLDGKRCLVASQVANILAHAAVPRRINERRIAEFLAVLSDDHHQSYFEQVYYCPPAHCLLVSTNSFRLWRYWEIDPEQRVRYRTDDEYAEHLHWLLQDAVRQRIRTASPVGISLSGGLDSSCLAALAAGVLDQENTALGRLVSFSYAFDELQQCDERAFIQKLVSRYDIEAHYVLCDQKWTLRHATFWPSFFEIPGQDSYYWMPHSIMSAARRRGCKVVIYGDLGDECFDSLDAWSAAVMRDGRIADFFHILMAQRQFFRIKRDLWENGLRQLIPFWLKRFYRSLNPLPPPGWLDNGIHPRLVDHLKNQLEQKGTPRNQFRMPGQPARYFGIFDNGALDGVGPTQGYFNRFGCELVYPYADRRVVEFVMALPADQIGHPGRSRWVQRNALHQALPAEIGERKDKTDFTPLFYKGIMELAQPSFWGMLADPEIVRREYIQRDWLKALVDSRSLGPSSGYILWNLFCLENWLQCYWTH